VRIFRQNVTQEDAIGPHACLLEESRRGANRILLGCPLFSPVHPVNCVLNIVGKDALYARGSVIELLGVTLNGCTQMLALIERIPSEHRRDQGNTGVADRFNSMRDIITMRLEEAMTSLLKELYSNLELLASSDDLIMFGGLTLRIGRFADITLEMVNDAEILHYSVVVWCTFFRHHIILT
jgi:hypothetical protein